MAKNGLNRGGLTLSKRILITYYSHSGNTAQVARQIARQTGGELWPIEPETPYPADYQGVLAQSEHEIAAGFRPVLAKAAPSPASYDVLFVGSPNWYNNIAPPVASFLEQADLGGKLVLPFCTHGGGGASRPFQAVAGLCPGARLQPGFSVRGNGGGRLADDLHAWLQTSGILD